MIEKLFKKVEEAHIGLCIVVEYFHVCDYVISIYTSPVFVKENMPLIRTEGNLLYAASEAYILLENYLGNTEDERKEIKRMNINIQEEEYGV